MVDLKGLPDQLVIALHGVRDHVQNLRKPYTARTSTFNPATQQTDYLDSTVTPKVSLIIDMPAPKTVRVYVQRTKPHGDPVLVKSITDDHYDALAQRVSSEKVSWEEFFNRVTADG